MASASQGDPASRISSLTPRTLALVLGVTFAVLTALELLVGSWAIGGAIILLRTTKLNLLHWAIALGLMGGRLGGPEGSRIASLVVGGVLVGLGLWGLIGPEALGGVLGFEEEIPWAYGIFHLLTGLGPLSGVFLAARKAA